MVLNMVTYMYRGMSSCIATQDQTSVHQAIPNPMNSHMCSN